MKGVGRAHTMSYNYTNPSAGWHVESPLPQPRAHMNMVQLPDGSAIGVGGNSTALYDVGQTQTLAYDPATDTWKNMAVQSSVVRYWTWTHGAIDGTPLLFVTNNM